MPSTSKAQQSVMAIAEHHPEKLFSRNKGLLDMSHKQLHDFASTPRRILPSRATRKNKGNTPKVSGTTRGGKVFEEE